MGASGLAPLAGVAYFDEPAGIEVEALALGVGYGGEEEEQDNEEACGHCFPQETWTRITLADGGSRCQLWETGNGLKHEFI